MPKAPVFTTAGRPGLGAPSQLLGNTRGTLLPSASVVS